MRDRDGKARVGLWRRVRAHCEHATLRMCRMELMGNERAVVQGCEEILEYGRERICLSVRDPEVARVVIGGTGLVCLSYHPDAVVVKGNISSIGFCRAEDT